jgi:hypothetical protein
VEGQKEGTNVDRPEYGKIDMKEGSKGRKGDIMQTRKEERK